MLDRVLYYWSRLGFNGAAAAAIGKLSGRPITVSVTREGTRHPIFLRVPSTDIKADEQVFRECQYQIDVKAAPSVIVDAGANIGLTSIYFANRFPDAKVFAIECEASNFRLLKRNVAAYDNIVPIHAALWGTDGEIEIVDTGLGHWGFMTRTKNADSANSSCVRAITLSALLHEHGLSHVDLLKIDIEGAEREVFETCASWIGSVDTVIAELHDRLKPGCEAAFGRATASFDHRWRQGESVCASRSVGCVIPKAPAVAPG